VPSEELLWLWWGPVLQCDEHVPPCGSQGGFAVIIEVAAVVCKSLAEVCAWVL